MSVIFPAVMLSPVILPPISLVIFCASAGVVIETGSTTAAEIPNAAMTATKQSLSMGEKNNIYIKKSYFILFLSFNDSNLQTI
jgi:hypothetical protein